MDVKYETARAVNSLFDGGKCYIMYLLTKSNP